MLKALLYVLRAWALLILLLGPMATVLVVGKELDFSEGFTCLLMFFAGSAGVALCAWFLEEYC